MRAAVGFALVAAGLAGLPLACRLLGFEADLAVVGGATVPTLSALDHVLAVGAARVAADGLAPMFGLAAALSAGWAVGVGRLGAHTPDVSLEG